MSGDAIWVIHVLVEVGVAVGAVHQLRDLDRFVRPHAADRVFLLGCERGIFVEWCEGGGVGFVGDVFIVEPLDDLDRLALAAIAEPVHFVDDVGARPVEGEFAGGGDGGIVQPFFERGDVLRQAVVADDELEFAGLLADGELDRALFAGRISVVDRMAGGGEDAFTELLGNGGVERPLFERFVGEGADAGEERAARW